MTTKGSPNSPGNPDDGNGDDDDDEDEKLYQDGSSSTQRDIVDSRSFLSMQKLIQFHILQKSFELESSVLLLMGRIDRSGNDYLSSWHSVAFKIGLSNKCM